MITEFDWEERFDKEFCDEYGLRTEELGDRQSSDGNIKAFIRKVISQSIEEERGRVEGIIKRSHKSNCSKYADCILGDMDICNCGIDDLLAEIKKGEK